jgi:hypothetical protein
MHHHGPHRAADGATCHTVGERGFNQASATGSLCVRGQENTEYYDSRYEQATRGCRYKGRHCNPELTLRFVAVGARKELLDLASRV